MLCEFHKTSKKVHRNCNYFYANMVFYYCSDIYVLKQVTGVNFSCM